MTTTNVLFEIGLEEMPARFLADTEKQLEEKTIDWLQSLRLPYKKLTTFVTPRRLAVVIEGLAEKQSDQSEKAKGPAKNIALDQDGNWSKAAIGFTKGQGKTVDDIYFEDVKGTEYVFVNKYIEGATAEKLLPSFKEVILNLNFPKNMRWADKNLRFIRPIRWIVALNNQSVIPIEIEGVTSSNITFGHRFLGEKFTINDPLSYQKELENQYVLVDSKQRKQMIINQIEQLEQKEGWRIPVDEELLEEVTQLVEYPTVFFGTFNEKFLDIPDEVLITSMKEHQRYFPVLNNTDGLLPYFVAVRNGDDKHIDVVTKGNEKVLKARLADAMFFYEEDQKQSIEENNKKLTRMVFQEKLGTISDKVNRVVKLTSKLTDLLEVDQHTKTNAIRAAEISKFDLVSNMVNEFTNLQGIMGEKYARIFGENEQVAKAVNEHYMPRSANGILPTTIEGSIVSIADKLDTIIGCISVGLIPSGSQDPYALRRQAMGVLQILDDRGWTISVETLLQKAMEIYQEMDDVIKIEEGAESHIHSFFYARASFHLKQVTSEQDIIQAVLASGIGNISFAYKKAQVLTTKKHDQSFKDTQEALVRSLNIAKKGEYSGVDSNLFENEYEKVLYDNYQSIKPVVLKHLDQLDAESSIHTLSELTNSIHAFFDHTMVMAENEKLKQNRISLLKDIAALVYQYADLSLVEWKQQASS
ncbi:glycine--tRNA ligase subunit beta [Paraliobacillus salinarum]|uniref:glycine--tRNA ligase subunit beta n=1 Tax=Paraliobacillus salinarum TaxID=1158996 RepID=UPI0015F5A22B|nr:glycine--tRNA ligase subunit beta [Paraliobacillus salinarum]